MWVSGWPQEIERAMTYESDEVTSFSEQEWSFYCVLRNSMCQHLETRELINTRMCGRHAAPTRAHVRIQPFPRGAWTSWPLSPKDEFAKEGSGGLPGVLAGVTDKSKACRSCHSVFILRVCRAGD